MSMLSISVISSFIWFAFFIVAHIGWIHLFPRGRLGRTIVRCFAISAMACMATVAISHGTMSAAGSPLPGLAAEAIALFLMCCAFVLYMPFVFTITTSLSIETLLLLDRSGGRMSSADLCRRFVSQDAARQRLETMRENQLVILENTRYKLTRKGVLVAEFFACMKRLWKLWPGG